MKQRRPKWLLDHDKMIKDVKSQLQAHMNRFWAERFLQVSIKLYSEGKFTEDSLHKMYQNYWKK